MKQRCYVCRSPARLRPSGPDPSLMVCPSCFGAVPRVLELERREAHTYEIITRALSDESRRDALLRGLASRDYAEEDVTYRDALSEARRILTDVAFDLQARQGNTHAASPITEAGETFYACSMPNCKLCSLATRAAAFLERHWI